MATKKTKRLKEKPKPERRAKLPVRKPPGQSKTFADRLLETHLLQLKHHIEQNGVKGLDSLYKEAKADLYGQLLKAGSLSERATAVQLRAMIVQIENAMTVLGGRVHHHLRDVAAISMDLGAKHGLDEFKQLTKHFTGTTPVLSLERAAIFRDLVSDVNSSLLSRYQLVSRTWTAEAIQNTERTLSVGTLAGKPLHAIVDDVMGSTGTLEDERWKAERIVRTENAYAHGATKHRAMEEIQEEIDTPLYKRLVSTFDDRTGDDSFLQHGQTVPLNQPFSWKHKKRGVWVVTTYMHPPNRPNDREVVIPWDPEWKETAQERPLSIAELRSASTTFWRKTPGVDIPSGHKPGRPYVGKGMPKKGA